MNTLEMLIRLMQDHPEMMLFYDPRPLPGLPKWVLQERLSWLVKDANGFLYLEADSVAEVLNKAQQHFGEQL